MKNVLNYITDMNKIEYGTIEVEKDEWAWGPAYIDGVYNPDEADAAMRKAQGELFRLMEAVGMPLCGFNQLDEFIQKILNGENIISAWKEATKQPEQYTIKSVIGAGTADDPFQFEI